MAQLRQNHPGFSQKGWGLLLSLLLLSLPLLLGGWKEVTGRRLNPRYIERIQDGKTKKHEILVLFGDPEEIQRSPEGLVFIYRTYRQVEAPPSREIYKPPAPQSTSIYALEEGAREEKKPVKKGPVKEVASTLTIRFGPDGETVQSHEYKEF
jgi:hypothetical protein